MKNLKFTSKLAIACITLSTFVSCSNSDDSINFEEKQLITSEKIPGVNSALPDMWELQIENNKLNKIIINSSSYDNLIYSNDKLIQVDHYTNNSITSVDVLNYSNGKVTSIVKTNSNDVNTLTKSYDYNDPTNLIKETVTSYDGTGTIINTYTKYVKIENSNLVNNNFENYQKDIYTYDNKSNFFSNLISLNEIVLYYANDKVSKNNRISSTSQFYFNGNLTNTSTINYNNTYVSDKITNRIVSINGLNHYKESFLIK